MAGVLLSPSEREGRMGIGWWRPSCVAFVRRRRCSRVASSRNSARFDQLFEPPQIVGQLLFRIFANDEFETRNVC